MHLVAFWVVSRVLTFRVGRVQELKKKHARHVCALRGTRAHHRLYHTLCKRRCAPLASVVALCSAQVHVKVCKAGETTKEMAPVAALLHEPRGGLSERNAAGDGELRAPPYRETRALLMARNDHFSSNSPSFWQIVRETSETFYGVGETSETRLPRLRNGQKLDCPWRCFGDGRGLLAVWCIGRRCELQVRAQHDRPRLRVMRADPPGARLN